jgi:hypothetical protein
MAVTTARAALQTSNGTKGSIPATMAQAMEIGSLDTQYQIINQDTPNV